MTRACHEPGGSDSGCMLNGAGTALQVAAWC